MMKANREKVIEYYQNLTNQIDILTENLLTKAKDDLKIQELNSTRQIFVDKIREIQDFNLEYLKSINKDATVIPEELFQPKFCFHLKESFGPSQGRLVITKKFVSDKIINIFNETESNESNSEDEESVDQDSDDEESDDQDSDDSRIFFKKRKCTSEDYLASEIYLNVFGNCTSEDIIDVSENDKHSLESVYVASLPPIDNLNVMEQLLDLTKLHSFELLVEYSFIFKSDTFQKLHNLTTLNLKFDKGVMFHLKMFDPLVNLKELSFGCDGNKQAIDLKLIKSLNKLETLRLFDVFVRPIKPQHLLKIKHLEIDSSEITFESSSSVQANLKSMCVTKYSTFTLDQPDSFKSYKCLAFINFFRCSLEGVETKSFNHLVNLEYLNLLQVRDCKIDFEELKLPNLKYLAINSNVIPKFKYLQLKYLKLNLLTCFSASRLVKQNNLIGISLIVKSQVYKKLNKKEFHKLKNLELVRLEIYKRKTFGFMDLFDRLNSEEDVDEDVDSDLEKHNGSDKDLDPKSNEDSNKDSDIESNVSDQPRRRQRDFDFNNEDKEALRLIDNENLHFSVNSYDKSSILISVHEKPREMIEKFGFSADIKDAIDENLDECGFF